MKLPYTLLPAILLLLGLPAFSQQGGAARLALDADNFNSRFPQEKVFIHFDRPWYNTGDTIWMKGYVLDEALSYSKQSGLLYVELINDTNKVAIRECLPIRDGISFSQMALTPDLVPQGNYTIRAYTNWMQNQHSETFFTRQFYIGKADEEPWLISTDGMLSQKDGKDNMEMALRFSTNGKNPVRLREMQLSVKNGDKLLSRDKLQTDLDGRMRVNLNLPAQDSKYLTIIAQDLRKGEGGRKLAIPVPVARPENTSLQFMPEGGQLVAGLTSVIGFKAIGEDGLGVNIKGIVTDSKGTQAASFESIHKGMGAFKLTPLPGENYTAKISLPDGGTKSFPLPIAKPNGVALGIKNLAGRDSLSVTIQGTGDAPVREVAYSLIAQSNGGVCYAAGVSFPQGSNVIKGEIDKKRFATGLVRFTLFNSQRQPLAERVVYVDNNDGLRINAAGRKTKYQPKDSVALAIHVADKNGKPVQGSFSLAITDDSQVKADSDNVANLQTYMLLTGGLKGEIEEPGYYFAEGNTGRIEALDCLLLAQGWSAYDWGNVFNPKYQPNFKPEPEMQINGHITRVGGKALAGLPLMLLSTKPVVTLTTVSDSAGRFRFTGLPKMDTASFMIQAKDKKHRWFEANIAVDEFTPADAGSLSRPWIRPWYVDSDSTLLNYMNQSLAYSNELDKIRLPAGTHLLKQVEIRAKKTIKGSHNLNGPGNADQILDAEEMRKAGKMTLMDLLYKKIKGFKPFQVYEKGLKIIFDGINMDFFYDDQLDRSMYDYLMRELSNYTAEDIKGIEVLYNNQYNGKYTVEYNPEIMALTPRPAWPAYIEITTWSGNGLFQERKRSNYLYRPWPITWPKEFYKPKYTATSNSTLANLRATIAWEPNIITDTTGKAAVWFYAKGKPGTYTGILQGANLDGDVGVKRFKIVVEPVKKP